MVVFGFLLIENLDFNFIYYISIFVKFPMFQIIVQITKISYIAEFRVWPIFDNSIWEIIVYRERTALDRSLAEKTKRWYVGNSLPIG
jgi:hypothetical protein